MARLKTASLAVRALSFVMSIALAACAADSADSSSPADADAGAPPAAYANWPDPFVGMRRGAEQTSAACARAGDDPVRQAFCAPDRPNFTSLSELQAALGLGSEAIDGFSQIAGGAATDLAITAHSTSLSMRSVSAINPRLITFRIELTNRVMLALAFTRGEQFIELVALDRTDRSLRFYVAAFRQACNSTAAGCSPGDLLTPAIERDWTELSLYDEADLANSVLDCATCHQPDGPVAQKLLLMQELNAPWTHWLWRKSEGGQALLADYVAARGDEPLAGMTPAQVEQVDPTSISAMIVLMNPRQTGTFDSTRVEKEIKLSAAELGGEQPMDNSIPGDSETWRAAYERAKRGEAISLPYHNVKVSDRAKLERMTAAYQAFRRGELERAALPDLRDVFPDDPARLAEIGFQTEPGLDGRGVLLQACSQCHNARLDPSLSRARFRADLDGMSRAERDVAIARLSLPEQHPQAMPPARLRVLSDEARQRAIDALRE